jgi:transaldolase
MEFFIDSANLNEIKEASTWGFVSGVTTNPSLMAKEGKSTAEMIKEIVSLINGPISAEVIGLTAPEMISEGKALSAIHDNIVIKVPLTPEGLKATKYFSGQGIKTNVTLVFSSNQALLAAKCGATYVSPFIGRLDDTGHDGMILIEEIRTVFDNYAIPTKILAASIRHPIHVRNASLQSADVATCPMSVLKSLFHHPLTTSGLEKFLQDYKSKIGG